MQRSLFLPLFLLALAACTPPKEVGSAPQIKSFTASPQHLEAPGSATLSWDVQGAQSLSLEPGIGPVSGSSKAVSVGATTTYTLTAKNAKGEVTAQTTVTVGGSTDPDTRAPKPLDVGIELDSGRAASATIPAAGGSLEATAADGTRFTLTVPEGALLSAQAITMTPIAKVNGLPLSGGYVGAVHLEPEGLEFLEPVTLKIEAAKPFDAAKLKGFNSHQTGQEFYLQGRKVEGQTVTLELMHFSNPGAAVATETDLSDLLVPLVPTDPRDRFEHDLGLDLTDASKVAGRYYQRVKGLLEAALTDETKIRQAIREFLAWRKEVSRLGLDEAFKAQIYEGWSLIAKAIENAVEKAYTACVVNEDITFVSEILGWVSWVKRNPRLKPYFEGKLEAFEAKAEKCASFELEFEFILTQRTTTPSGMGYNISDITSNHHVTAKVPFSYSAQYSMLVGQGPLQTLKFTASGYTSYFGPPRDPDCPSVKAGKDETFADVVVAESVNGKSEMYINLLGDLEDPNKTHSYMTLVFNPAVAIQTFILTCDHGTFEVGGADGHGGWAPLFPPLHGYDLYKREWWKVDLEFEGQKAEYSDTIRYAGPHPLMPDTDVIFEASGSTKLIVRHTPK
ncbi:hypothetical protein [Calidithermus chliarophilus]|uniref:hypothetical protein n=1 Tax=Calidithermus chliarophilus TaxID=52023 RepID=UPI0003FA5FAF|nr:hypothetical protein [Calidithermus chliarophilus]